jgi:hypothetical protein
MSSYAGVVPAVLSGRSTQMPTDSEFARARRVLNLYFILRERAKAGGSLLTYGEGAERVGVSRPEFCLGPFSDLEVLATWIKSKELPPLWILLRSRDDMLPGEGNTTVALDELGVAHAAVAAYQWDDVAPPTIEELISAFDSLRKTPGA